MKKTKHLVITMIAAICCSLITDAQSAWTPKASLTGGIRFGAVSFSIGNKGYVGTGYTAFGTTNDFWEFDPVADTWTQKANVGGLARYQAIGFSANGKGYIGSGIDVTLTNQPDFWEYNPVSNTWAAKPDVPGPARESASAFSIGTKGYVGLGDDINGVLLNDIYEYNTTNSTWTQKGNFGGSPRFYATGLSIGSKGYIGMGEDATGSLSDFYEYDPSTDSWAQRASCDGNGERTAPSSFTIGNKGYVTLGENNNLNRAVHGHKDLWEYDPTNDSWTAKEDFMGTKRSQGIGFAVNGKGYAGTGIDPSGFVSDVYEFSPLYCATVATAPVITGPQVVCGVVHPVYTAVSTGSNSYQWTVPTGITINSGQGTGRIFTTVAAGTVIGNITCTAINACGSSTTTTYSITKKPGLPGAISGTSLCGNTTAVYSIAPVFGATSYNWSVPTGLTIVGAAHGTTITVSKSSTFVVGNISVSAVNGCGCVPGTVKTVYGKVPATPAPVSGLMNVCAPSTSSYSTAGSNGATAYQWSITGNATVTGSGLNATVSFGSGFTTGTLSIIATNPCGSSYAKTLTIQKITCSSEMFSQNNELKSMEMEVAGVINFNLYPNPVASAFTLDISSAIQQSPIADQKLIMEVYDVLGNKVFQSLVQNPKSEFNIESFHKGMYFVRIIDSNSNTLYSQRVIKE